MDPRARHQELLTSELANELLIFDARCRQVHRLNATAREIWMFCDGRTSLQLLAKIASKTSATTFDADMVWYVLEDLRERDFSSRLRRHRWVWQRAEI